MMPAKNNGSVNNMFRPFRINSPKPPGPSDRVIIDSLMNMVNKMRFIMILVAGCRHIALQFTALLLLMGASDFMFSLRKDLIECEVISAGHRYGL